MLNQENIVRYSAEELKLKIARGETQTDWARIRAMTEEELEAAIASDPDSDTSDYDWDNPIIGLPPMPEPKKPLHIRFDGDVIRWFKRKGRGYQTRMNAVLRHYMLVEQQQELKKAQSRKPADTAPVS